MGDDRRRAVKAARQVDLGQQPVEHGTPVLARAMGQLELDDVERQPAIGTEISSSAVTRS